MIQKKFNAMTITSLCMIIFLTACASPPKTPESPPAKQESTDKTDKTNPLAWYMNLPREDGYIYGYGDGQTQKEADARALENIATQMLTRVQSKLETQSSITGAEQVFSLTNKLSQTTDVEIAGAEPVRAATVDNRHYTAWRFNNNPLRVRALQAVLQEQAVDGSSAIGRDSLKVGLPLSVFLENNGKSADFILGYRNGMHQLNINGQNIPVSRTEFPENFMANQNPERFTIVPGRKDGLTVPNLPPGSLKNGQHYLVRYTPASSGFLNTLIMDSAGLVLAMIKNQPVRAGQTVEYPDTNLYDGLIASKTGKGTSSTDMLLAIESDKPLNFINRIQSVTEFGVNPHDDAFYIWGDLLERLAEYRYSAMTQRIMD